MTRHRSAYAAALLLAGLTALTAGCSGDDEAGPAPEDAGTASTSASATAGASAGVTAGASAGTTATPARLVAERNGSGASCLERVRRGDRYTVHDPTLVAEGDVTITRVDAAPSDGTVALLEDQQVVTITSEEGFGPGVAIGEEWPIRGDAVLRRKTDWAARGPLVGREVADGERILPLLGFRVAATDVVVEGVDITYEGADGVPQTVRAAVGTRVAAGAC